MVLGAGAEVPAVVLSSAVTSGLPRSENMAAALWCRACAGYGVHVPALPGDVERVPILTAATDRGETSKEDLSDRGRAGAFH
jgi:hypothetical protein